MFYYKNFFSIIKKSEMSATKKRRVEDEGRTFQEQWTNKYFFVAHAEKALCLVCKKSIPVMKDYNLRRHFEKNHEAYQLLIGEKRTQKDRKRKWLHNSSCSKSQIKKHRRLLMLAKY